MNTNGDKPKILIVDDRPENINILDEILKPFYRRAVALSGKKAIEIADAPSPPDLILLDIMMPEMDGYQVCRTLRIKEHTRKIPVIFVTANSDPEAETAGFETGAVDFITKPISPPIVLSRVKTQLELKLARDYLEHQNDVLEKKVIKRTAELALTQEVTVQSLASLAETRDNETGGHIQRTQHYVKVLAQQLATNPRYANYLNHSIVEMLFKCAPLHDIGKVGVPDSVLLKPDRLTPQEFEEMKKHTEYGKEAFERALKLIQANSSSSFVQLAMEIAFTHHEKWDGSGYPCGISGEEIPISGRLMALADVYDALISKRVYKAPMPHSEARGIILENKGSHFDPAIVDAFMEIHTEFQKIAQKFADHEVERRLLAQ